ncbi:hypothetical protein F2Q69_00055345 [Brassica cretica]|uniref:FRIGIDA-like protein n=1 Tax=Brassica cretica TaxID=69181 RepID=A0A8S9N5G8_BRACR|nr:hypothetical protein F2Q69_00055345 [Brassica cretica]
MEKRSVEDEPALSGAKKLKTDSSQMLKTLHDHLNMVIEEVEVKENQLQALSLKLAEIQKQVEQQTDKLKAIEVEASDKEKALGLIRNQIKSEEKTLIELRTSLEHTGNELELKKAELKKTGNEFELKKAELEHTGNELELKKTELKNTEIRLRSSVLVKHETQPIAAEPELSTGDAFLLHELSTIGLERHEVSSYLRAISNPAKFVPDLVDRQLRTAYRRQKLGCLQESLLKNLVLFLEELAGIGGLEKPQLQFKAKELASTWKENITIEAPISSLEALAFLLFIVAFGLKSLINEEEAALLASSVFHYTQGPKLFQFFGLKRKIPEFVRDLIKDHQYIPAVRIICLLDLKDFSATTLLMKEITVLRHSAMGKVQNKDVGRLRAIVELVADYKLDIDLPGELIAKLVFLRENSTPPELHCSVEVAEETCTSSSNSKAACSGVDLLVPKRETKPLVNLMY